VPESNAGRRRLVLVACGVIALAAYAFALSFLNRQTNDPPQSADGLQRASLGSSVNRMVGGGRVAGRFRTHLERATSHRILESENGAYRSKPPREAAVVAHRFLRAYLRYESMRPTRGALVTLRHLGTPSLSQMLLQAPPRIPNGASPPLERLGRLGPIRQIVSPVGPAFTASAVILRDGRPGVLSLTLVRSLGNLRVADIGR
jgi:hypothetical protein